MIKSKDQEQDPQGTLFNSSYIEDLKENSDAKVVEGKIQVYQKLKPEIASSPDE